MKSNQIVCFGEVLWDLFPEGKQIGGAPFNVACSFQGLGTPVHFISRIGKDVLGQSVLAEINKRGMSTEFIQLDEQYETGKVEVALDHQGVATYKIAAPAAWDFIESRPEIIQLVRESSAFIFGSLITRSASYNALKICLEEAPFSVFDLNLRPPFYRIEILEKLMHSSHMLKFNDEELYFIAEEMGSPFKGMNQHIEYISEKTNTEYICVTKGMYGAVLFQHGQWFYNSGFKVEVVDTVGAGDSFLATLVTGLINKRNSQKVLDEACAMGAMVAASKGANPSVTKEDLNNFIHPKII
jgi:fructokinase